MNTRRLLVLSFRSALLAGMAVLTGCGNISRISQIGDPPPMSKIGDPTKTAAYQPVSLPMPTPNSPSAGANSLWRPGARDFLKDQRAADVGDIVTVQVSMADSASLANQTQTTTANSEGANPFTFLGYENSLNKVLPKSANPSSLWSFGSNSAVDGKGSLQRSEAVTINMAAVVTQKLPNGNLVIQGTQELRVNDELRQLSVQGVIRPSDIASGNTISSDQIAEARIVYGGQGTVSDIQKPRWGQQLFDLLSPF